jgi:arginine/ornithine N-succinyltransferase beta subunit
MSTTIQTTTLDDREVFDNLVEVFTGGPTIEAWLETMWGVRPGHSSPVCQVSRYDYGSEVAAWLHRLWGLAPLHGGSV